MASSSIVTCGLNSLQFSNRTSYQRSDPFSSSSSASIISFQKYKSADGCSFPANRRPSSFPHLRSGSRISQRSKMEFIVYSADQAGDLLPFGINFPNFVDSWPAWMPGVVMAIIIPFFTKKWGPLSVFKEELDKVEVAVDSVADKVEEMAENVEKIVGDIADDLPEGSVLRTTLEKVESVADKVGKDAEMVSDMIDKMDEFEAKVEDMLEKATEKNNNNNVVVPAKADVTPAKVAPPSSTNI